MDKELRAWLAEAKEACDVAYGVIERVVMKVDPDKQPALRNHFAFGALCDVKSRLENISAGIEDNLED